MHLYCDFRASLAPSGDLKWLSPAWRCRYVYIVPLDALQGMLYFLLEKMRIQQFLRNIYVKHKSINTKGHVYFATFDQQQHHWTTIPDNRTHHVSSPSFARHVLLHLLSSPLGIFEDLRCRRFTPPPVEMVVYPSTSLVLWLLGCLKTRKKRMEQMVEMVSQRWHFQTSQLSKSPSLVVCCIMRISDKYDQICHVLHGMSFKASRTW